MEENSSKVWKNNVLFKNSKLNTVTRWHKHRCKQKLINMKIQVRFLGGMRPLMNRRSAGFCNIRVKNPCVLDGTKDYRHPNIVYFMRTSPSDEGQTITEAAHLTDEISES